MLPVTPVLKWAAIRTITPSPAVGTRVSALFISAEESAAVPGS